MKAQGQEEHQQFENNRKQFLEENPYASQEMGKSRRRSQQKEKSMKRSAFEKFDEIRYSCYQIDENIQQLGSTMEMIHVDQKQECVQVPLELFEKMQQFTQLIQKDFKSVQSQWSEFFDEQQETNQKYRGKSKTYKKKLSELENQSIIYMKDQKEFEKSLVDITKEHDLNKDKMGLVLDQMESQVSELKNTRQCLNLNYESQLDKAVKEMINFYNNLEGDLENDLDSVNIDRVFFIKPTHEINLRIQNSSSGTGLKIQNQGISSEVEEIPKTKTVPQKTAIPRIQMEKLIQKVISPKKEQSPKPQNEAEDYVTNPVMLGAMHQTSKFDHQYEDDFEGCNITMDMQTSRLAQFPEEYEMLQHIEDGDQRIIMKQMVFFKYEKLLKKQAKVERKKAKKLKKMLLEQQKAAVANSGEKTQVAKTNRSLIPTPTNRSGMTKFGQPKPQFGNLSSKSSQKQMQLTKTNGLNIGNKQVNDANEYTGMVTSRFSMQSELPSIDTIDCASAQKKFRGQDVNHSEIINCEEILVHGLKSATQKSLIRKIEEEFRQKEIIRDQQKGDEKKLNYSSSTQSKISLLGKQVSQGSLNSKVGMNMLSDQMLAKQYGSNSHSNSNPKLIVVDSEYSMNSNVQKQSKKRLDSLNVEINLDMLPNIHFGQEFDPSNLSLITPSDVKIRVLDNDKIDESFLSANSQYQRFFDQNQDQSESKQLSGGYPSPQLVHNSYIQSSNQSAENLEKLQHDYHDEPQQLVDRIDDDIKNIRKRLPLDVIQERQSEFSQSMMTNAAKLNSHRSRQNVQYHNMSRVTQNGLPTGRSDANNKSSSRKKNERPPLCDMEDYKNYNSRPVSQAQTSRNEENQRHNNSVGDGFAQKSRNSIKKESKSSIDIKEPQNYVFKKQPSVGKIENQNRQRYLKNFETDMNELMPSGFNVQKCPPPIPNAVKSKSFQKQTNNYVNLTAQNSQLNSEREYQPHSQRSHIGGESLRNRSYFDESPAIFENGESNNDISAKRDNSDRYLVVDSSQTGTGILQMQTIPLSHQSSAARQVVVKEEKPTRLMIRSNSECQLRDKEFYEMCDEEDEIAMFCKFAEQNILENMHVRNLSKEYNAHKNVAHLHNQSSEGQTQFFPSAANKSNQLVFLSQQTYNRLNGLQSRGKATTIQKLQYDPTRLLASINNPNGIQANGPQVSYLGTNLLTNSLDAATTLLMHNQIMMPTHQYNRRTLLMMQNLHNNYLYSANSGILFTMQRGWNSGVRENGASTNPQIGIGQVFKNMTNVGKNSSLVEGKEVGSLGGDPVNISNLLMGAKQPTSEHINVGCVTIVDDDGKFLMDRKMLLEANNFSHQTNARRFSMSRNIYGQVTTSDFSNLQTKQLGILRNNLRPPPAVINTSTMTRNFKNDVFDNVGTSKNDSEQLFGVDLVEPTSEKHGQKKKTDQKGIMNFITGLKQIQMKQQNRPGSDLSTEQQNIKKMPAKWSQDQGPRIIQAQGDIESQTSQGNLTTVKSQAKKGINSNGLLNLKNMIKQKQNQMNLSQSIQLNNDSLLQKQHVLSGNFKTVISQKNIVKLKSKSQPKNDLPQKEDIIQKNQEIIDEIRKLQGQKMGTAHTQNSSDFSSVSKKNKVKLVSNIKSSQNFNTIQNQNSEMTLKIQQAQSLRSQQNYTTVQTSQKPMGTFMSKKNSYQGVPQKSARTSQPSAIFIGHNGKLSIKKKVLNQQISMPNSLV